jgi:two-component system sensor histidine kinase UhpB
VQEALSNVLKHSGAKKARVTLIVDEADDVLHIEIADDGVGFAPTPASSGIGIIGMRERVVALGGTINFSSAINDGTVVEIDLPLRWQSGRAAHAG